MDSLNYLWRCIGWNIPKIDDYKRFTNALVAKGNTIFPLEQAPEKMPPPAVSWNYKGQPRQGPLPDLLANTGTTACIILQQGQIRYEQYFNGYQRDSINTSFSVAKSMTSALIGIAIAEGAIHSVEDPVARYLPAFDKKGQDQVTIAHLLQMCSGLAYREGVLPWTDDARVYYGLRLRDQALKANLIETPGTVYHYNNYNLLLLGLILEKTTSQPVPAYFSEKIWQPMGAEADASWSVDSRHSGFAKMESGFNALAIDFARFGQLCLQNGALNGHSIIPADWMHTATSAPTHKADTKTYLSRMVPPLCKWAGSPHGYYKYGWWGYQTDAHNFDYFALGAKGQFIYISPRKQAVIVRFGKQWGAIDWWPELLKQLADSLA
ncbi:serine hydrolase domain-containing protein [Chitinophaga qingshengii]|uniref:Serine hydrolase n=1 Tax=Chitinophaga qingshengii TaxID=1569794 RepID=A0ABR7TJU2_9BACT|nr:serine hydrolase [Chitinophaga qingshengii]MBC9930757.1 serine hydrolase [Chitinophaga qingshengii]